MKKVYTFTAVIGIAFLGFYIWINLPHTPPLTHIFDKGGPYEDLILANKYSGDRSKFLLTVCRESLNSNYVFRSEKDIDSFLSSLKSCNNFKKLKMDTGLENFSFFRKVDYYEADRKEKNWGKSLSINFDKYIVLANKLYGGCGSKIYKKVSYNNIDKTIEYDVAESSKYCVSGPGKGGMNFIAVKKPQGDFKIKFR